MTISSILLKHIGHNLYFDLSNEQIDRICEAMQEAITLDRENVANNAEAYLKDSLITQQRYVAVVDKSSIINAPNLEIK